MSNSSLVNCKVMSPNHSGKRTHTIDTITPHCVVGQLSAESIGSCFTNSSVQASCNYGIGTDGRVVLCVDEDNRSWCSSNRDNDQRAVTIECASDKTHPYAMNDKVYSKLIDLCVDICKRNGKTKLLFLGSEEATLKYNPKNDEMVLTAHRWFANKSCPGDWLYSRFGELADKVTSLLTSVEAPKGNDVLYRVQVGAYGVKSNADAQLQKIKKAGFSDAFIAKVDNLYKIQVGAFSKKENADNMLSKVKKAGFSDAFITTQGGTVVSSKPTPTEVKPAKKSIDQMAREIINDVGNRTWGVGSTRVSRLGEAGYSTEEINAIQKRINQLLG